MRLHEAPTLFHMPVADVFPPIDAIRSRLPSAEMRRTLDEQHLIRVHKLIFEPLSLIAGQRILEPGAGHGLFSRLMSLLGAEQVTSLEVRAEHQVHFESMKQLENIPDDRLRFVRDDYRKMGQLFRPGDFETLFCAGLFYHMTDHLHFLHQARRLGVKNLILETAVTGKKNSEPLIHLEWEDGDERWNALPGPFHAKTLVGKPNRAAMQMLLEEAGWRISSQFDFHDHPVPGPMDSLRNGQHCLYICHS